MTQTVASDNSSTAVLPAMTSRVADKLFWPLGLLLVAVAALLRLPALATRPGYEWDEPVYVFVSRELAKHGLVQGKIDYMARPEPYLYHPPFHFLLEAGWFKLFGAGVYQARLLAVVSALLMMIGLLALLRRIIGSWALLAVGLIATDAWMIFSERVAWIENTLLLVGVVGLYLYRKAMEARSTMLFVLAGFVLGLTTAYKHVGIIFLGAAAIHWLLVRSQNRKHVAMFVSAVVVITLYVTTMAIKFGDVFWRESSVQFRRSTGTQQSRGALNSIHDIVSPLLAQYKIFVATLILAAAALCLIILRTVQMIKAKGAQQVREYSLLYAWAVAALLFFVVLQLRFPHYFMLVLIPLLVYLAAEIRRSMAQRRHRAKQTGRRALAMLTAVLIVSNGLAFYERFVAPKNDAALRNVGIFATEYMPADAKVIADESVGVVIPQQYCKIWRGANCTGATFVITYTSHTQRIPDDPGLHKLIDTGTLVYETVGYKERIRIYRLPKPVGQK